MKVLITPRGFANYGIEAIGRMEAYGLEVDWNGTGKPYDPQTFLEKAKKADAVIVGVDRCDRTLLEQCPNLKVICKFGVGTDNIDLACAQQRGVFVGRTLGTNALSVAEHVLGLIFADAKNLFSSIGDVKEGGWGKPTGLELSEKTLGIIGFGAIGRRLAKMVDGIGMHVIAYDSISIDLSVAHAANVAVTGLDELLALSDYVSLHVPLLDSTKNMISSPQLRRMKKNACLINAARGGVVDEDALYEALIAGEIRSACFDVFSVEPPEKGCRLLSLDAFLLTPHTASRTHESEQRTCEVSTDIVLTHLGYDIDDES